MNILNKSFGPIFDLYRNFLTVAKYKKNLLSDSSFLNKGLLPVESSLSEEVSESIVDRINMAYKKAIVSKANYPSVYEKSGSWQFAKKQNEDYYTSLEQNNSKRLRYLLQNFFRNNCIKGLIEHGYYGHIAKGNKIAQMEYVNSILSDYMIWDKLVEDIEIKMLEAPPIGNPWGYFLEGVFVQSSSFRHNYYANYIKNLMKKEKCPVIVEIGSGFGGVGYYLMASGAGCKYIAFDLPETLTIAQYYLMAAFPEKKVLLMGEIKTDEITKDVIDKYDIILMPHFQIRKLAENSVDALMNAHSFSEMGFSQIEEYMRQIGRVTKTYFFHDNSRKKMKNWGNHKEIISDEFPVPEDFRLICKMPSPWKGGAGRYWQYLYEKS